MAPGEVPRTTERIFRQQVLTRLGIYTDAAFVPTMTSQTWLQPLHSLVDQLSRWECVLLIVDGYRPQPSFADWFTNSFIPEVKNAEVPVVILVADQSGKLAELRPFADEVVTLGPLDPQAVKQHFKSIGQQVAPPMKAAELDVYVKVASKDPAKLAILSRVLRLSQPGEGSTSLRLGEEAEGEQ